MILTSKHSDPFLATNLADRLVYCMHHHEIIINCSLIIMVTTP